MKESPFTSIKAGNYGTDSLRWIIRCINFYVIGMEWVEYKALFKICGFDVIIIDYFNWDLKKKKLFITAFHGELYVSVHIVEKNIHVKEFVYANIPKNEAIV